VFYLWTSLTLGIAVLCLIVTLWPSGVTATPIGEVARSGGAGMRVFLFLFALLLVAAVRDRWLKTRYGATITLHGRRLVLLTPGLWWQRRREWQDLEPGAIDVAVGQDGDRSLAINGQPVLIDFHFPHENLEATVAALREAISAAPRH
jgi:hypothetical protein